MDSRDRSKYKILGTDDEGVSPVIGVILMVAITVVMAAIVSSWSAGVKAPNTPTTVGLDVQRSDTLISTVVTAIDPSTAAPIKLNFTYQSFNSTDSSFSKVYSENSSVDVGFTRTIDTNSNATKQFVVTAIFKDNSKRVLYSRDT